LDEKPIRRSLMSHTLRRMQRPEAKQFYIILSDELPTYWRSEQLPTPQQQLDALILWIGANQRASFENAETTASVLAAHLGMHISQQGDGGGLGWLLGQFKEKKQRNYSPNWTPVLESLALNLPLMAGRDWKS
jgi:hypothetical protein